MAIQLRTQLRNDRLDAIDDDTNGGTPPATIDIFTGTPPVSTTAADTGTKLATLTMSNPAYGAASGGLLTAAAITADTSADASGTPGHFRKRQGGGGPVVAQGTCTVGAGGDLQFNQAISLGGNVSISSWVLTEGNA